MIHLRSDSVRITTAWLRAGYALATRCTKAITLLWLQPKLLLYHSCNLKQRTGLPRHPHISGCRECDFATNSSVISNPQSHGRERQRRTGWLAGWLAGQPVAINDDKGQKRTMDSWMRIVGLWIIRRFPLSGNVLGIDAHYCWSPQVASSFRSTSHRLILVLQLLLLRHPKNQS